MMRFLVIGDVMKDVYTHVSSSRKAPEADIPVWDENATFSRAGGAANVARNLANIDSFSYPDLVGIADPEQLKEIADDKNLKNWCLSARRKTIMVKHRFFTREADNPSIVFRTDNIRSFDDEEKEYFSNWFSGFMTMVAPSREYKAIVISDYGKGTCTESVIKDIVEFKKKNPLIPVFIDSKAKDLVERYAGFSGMSHVFLKINKAEFSFQREKHGEGYLEKIFRNCVTTLGPDGACWSYYSNLQVEKKNIPGYGVDKEVDMTGCGDTHMAGMAYYFVRHNESSTWFQLVEDAIKFGNFCASRVITKFGTSIALVKTVV